MYPQEYAQFYRTKALRSGTVSEDRLKGILIEGLHRPIHQIIRGYWSKSGEAYLQYQP